MVDLVDKEHRKKAGELLNIMATYKKAEDLINIGAYQKGSNPEIDYAINMIGRVNTFLRQAMEERVSFEQAKLDLFALFEPMPGQGA